MHGLGVLDDQVSSTFIRNRTSEQRFDLLGDTEIVEYRQFTGVSLYDLFPSGSDQTDIIADVMEYVRRRLRKCFGKRD